MFRWLYPTTCEFCGEASELSICPDCLDALPHLEPPFCLYCGCPVSGEGEDPYVCDACREKPRTFSFSRSALVRCPEVMDLVYRLKYHHAQFLAEPLAMALADLWETTPQLAAHDWTLVPVPVTYRRCFDLGYNHAEALARGLARHLGLQVVDALVRKVSAKRSQTRLTMEDRYNNALDAYAPAPAFASGKKSLPPYLLLVDDVYTTGATTRACAKYLKALPGVQEVGALTLVRAD